VKHCVVLMSFSAIYPAFSTVIFNDVDNFSSYCVVFSLRRVIYAVVVWTAGSVNSVDRKAEKEINTLASKLVKISHFDFHFLFLPNLKAFQTTLHPQMPILRLLLVTGNGDLH
jgi:hypothetical protein